MIERVIYTEDAESDVAASYDCQCHRYLLGLSLLPRPAKVADAPRLRYVRNCRTSRARLASVAASYDWYESREPGLGEDFLRCVEACVLTIQRHPLLYPVAVDGFRRALVRRFPYEVFYEPTANVIVIYSVFHCSQDPQKWRTRLGYGT